jgi:NADH-quinone oxidoreductase subunit K
MTELTLCIWLGAILFGIGLVGFLSRRNLIVVFLCTEVMFQGVIVKHWGNLQGQSFALFLLVIAAVEAGLALALIVVLYRRRGSLDTEVWTTLRG